MLVGLFLFHCSLSTSINLKVCEFFCQLITLKPDQPHVSEFLLILLVPHNPPNMYYVLSWSLSIFTQPLMSLLAPPVPALLQEQSAFGRVEAVIRAEIITFQGIISISQSPVATSWTNIFIKAAHSVTQTECKMLNYFCTCQMIWVFLSQSKWWLLGADVQ